MAKLPTPSWLTLPETLDWLEERGVSRSDAKLRLPRAFRDFEILTRGRSKNYTGDDSQNELFEGTWDQAVVDWEESSFTIPSDPSYRKDHKITDVDVSLEGLSGWIENSENQQLKPNKKLDVPPPERGRAQAEGARGKPTDPEEDAAYRNRIETVVARGKALKEKYKSAGTRELIRILFTPGTTLSIPLGTKKFEGFSRGTVRIIWRGRYAPVKRLGLKGIF